MLKHVANTIGRCWLQHNNPRTVCPPGSLIPASGPWRPLIIVPTVMRSGTHLLIDLILNNFAGYKRKPLYVDLDRVLDRDDGPRIVDQLAEYGGYVVKTHYPQVRQSAEREASMRMLLTQAFVITTERDTDEIIRSTERFTQLRELIGNTEEIRNSIDSFYSYWRKTSRLPIPFSRLVAGDEVKSVIRELSEYMNQIPNTRAIIPFSREQRSKVYVAKAMTRILGCRAKVVNTTIGFAQ